MIKKLIFVILLLVLNQHCKGQISIFGVDITKYKPSESVSKKYNCTPNPYFIFAEWRYDQSVYFECYTAKNKTPQMKEPRKYMKELYVKLSKTLGQPFYIYNPDGENGSNVCHDFVIWRFKYQNVYYILELKLFSNWGHTLIINYCESYDKVLTNYENGFLGISSIDDENFNKDLFLKFPEYVLK